MLKFFVLFGLVLCVANRSETQAKIELFGGYSYFRASVDEGQFGPLGPGAPCAPNCGSPPHVAENANLNSWEFSGQYEFLPFFGGVVDFNGTYKLDGAGTVSHLCPTVADLTQLPRL